MNGQIGQIRGAANYLQKADGLSLRKSEEKKRVGREYQEEGRRILVSVLEEMMWEDGDSEALRRLARTGFRLTADRLFQEGGPSMRGVLVQLMEEIRKA
jgi:hypothetical protein